MKCRVNDYQRRRDKGYLPAMQAFVEIDGVFPSHDLFFSSLSFLAHFVSSLPTPTAFKSKQAELFSSAQRNQFQFHIH